MGKKSERLAQQVAELEGEVASLEHELAAALRMVVSLLESCGEERLRYIDLMLTEAELDSLTKMFGDANGDAQRLVPERGEPLGVPGGDALHDDGPAGAVRVRVPRERG
jgi:cell division septum initiation protein DivIVA